ncbi:hypothetical protein [Candidatus Frankia alpina]|uniref:hypothetical protein n=1 Tax=Candidatus Frankia alpina TaxID=2699483 RepID=UPI002E259482
MTTASTTTASERPHGCGPDVLGSDWDLDAVVAQLRATPQRQIGAALLDQRIIAGRGNIWRTEACFVTGVPPWTPVGDIPDLPGLVRRAQAMIKAGAHGGHQVTTGSLRPGEEHWVYGRAGRPCRRCGSRILTADQGRMPGRVGDESRRTTWCPDARPDRRLLREPSPIADVRTEAPRRRGALRPRPPACCRGRWCLRCVVHARS